MSSCDPINEGTLSIKCTSLYQITVIAVFDPIQKEFIKPELMSMNGKALTIFETKLAYEYS